MKNKLTFIDLFAGCGGLSLGLENAGFTPIFVNELNKDALATYLENRKKEFPYLEEFNCNDVKDLLKNKSKVHKRLKSNKLTAIDAKKDLDLLVGGPPCQGFSGIGHRRSYAVDKKDIPSNHLFEDMKDLVKYFKPKIFLFENVRGLLAAKWDSEGEKGEIFKAVRKSFDIKGYKVHPVFIRAKDYGVPQNRPRVFLVGIRKDLKTSKKVPKTKVEDENLNAAIEYGLFPSPEGKDKAPDLIDLLGDLIDPQFKKGLKETKKYPKKCTKEIQQYFRKKTLNSNYIFEKGDEITDHVYSQHKQIVTEKFQYMIDNNGDINKKHKTKKFSQRLLKEQWKENGPNITATSLPDDYVHFSQPRTLTVREWARLQTFPDWYVFKGKRTTGGVRRAGNPREGIFEREVPKYTQIGNAVPVKLAEEIGKHLKKLIS